MRRVTAGRARMAGALAALVALAAVGLAFAPPQMPWNQVVHLSVQAAGFGEIGSGTFVEIGGVRVGTVDSTTYEGGQPVIHLTVQKRYAALLHADAGAWVRPHGLLGPKYVELSPGTAGSLADGATIPAARTAVSTDLDQVLNSLQDEPRQNLQTLFVELGTASESRGDDMHQAFTDLGAASADLAKVTGVLNAHEQDLSQFFVQSEIVSRDMQSAPIDSNIADTNTVLSGLAQVDSSIGGSIDHTAGTLQSINTVMNGNSSNLAYAIQQGPATLTRLQAFLANGNGLLTGINPSLPYLMTAVVYTRSAFGGGDANGHWVHVYLINGACTLGASANTSCATPGGQVGGPGSATPAQPVQPHYVPRFTDDQLVQMMLGG